LVFCILFDLNFLASDCIYELVTDGNMGLAFFN